MIRRRWGIRRALISLVILAGCAHTEYPPPYPAQIPIPFLDNSPLIPWMPPPQELAWHPPTPGALTFIKGMPTPQEWHLWQERTESKQVCRGKGKQRTCRTILPVTAVDVANKQAVVRPTAAHTNMGTSTQVRYVYDPGNPAYTIYTSPMEYTTLFLMPGERRAIGLPLPESDWEVQPGEQGLVTDDGTTTVVRQFLLVRPKWKDMTTRALLPLAGGQSLALEFISREQRGMLSVAWELPPKAPELPPIPIDKQPPRFDAAHAYSGYKLELTSKGKYRPAWYPEGVADDGQNTLIKFPGILAGIRAPVVQGLTQAGKPVLVQSRLFVREDVGALLYVQGLHPALLIRDAAGLQVQATRLPPDHKEGESNASASHHY